MNLSIGEGILRMNVAKVGETFHMATPSEARESGNV